MCGTHAWHAVVRASEALDALKDAMFIVEELRQAHAGIWEAPKEASPGRLLLALDDARDRLVKARDEAEEASNMQPASEETSKLSKTRANIYAEFVRIHAEALDLEFALESDRALFVLYDVCVQCERHMSTLEAALSRESDDSEAMRVKKHHTMHACERLLATIRQSTRPNDHVKPRIARIEERWDLLQRKCGVVNDADVVATAAVLDASLSLSTTKRRASESNDTRKRRWSFGTPSRIPRTPTGKTNARTPSSTQQMRSMHFRLPVESPEMPRWTDTLARHDASPSIEHFRARSAMEHRPSSSQGKRLRRRESMLPRISRDVPAVPPIPSTFASPQPDGHARLRAHPSIPILSPRTPSTTGRTTPGASGRVTPGRSHGYIPDGKDPLDIAVARLCNVRGIRIERLDETCRQDGDLIHRYAMFSKTVACRLLRMVCI